MSNLKKIVHDNGLSITLLACFLILWVGQAIVGFFEFNDDAKIHQANRVTFARYLISSHFWEATFENWESEFLQMSAYVVLTVFLYQRGSAESNDPEKPGENDEYEIGPDSPGVVKSGGWKLKLYEHSLSLSLLSLFLISWVGHALAGFAHYNEGRHDHGMPLLSLGGYLASPRFWFESFQNWQSEFLAVASIVLLSIWLREKGSPESKPVSAPHRATGE